ncbi:MAG: alcohol dehydrogenase catalytic domain-containing protein [Verrucomicrobia bacterium]|nr:alcohol dehydrogenase catalytic domain-containing protein [Verrucomicrobiota bacterium]
MKAIVIHGYGGPEVLKYEDYPDTVPAAGEVLVRVAASSVNPFDFKIRSGALKDFFPLTFSAIFGLHVSGTVESVGSGVTTFARGEKVFAIASQTYAALCVVKATNLPMQVTPDPNVLLAMANAVESGAFSIPLGQKFSLQDAGKAHTTAEKGGAGKILLMV